MKLDFENDKPVKSAKEFLTEISTSVITNSKKLEKIQANTGLTKDEIMALIYEKRSKRLHINIKPTLYEVAEKYAKNKNTNIATLISNLLLQEMFKKK